MARYWVERDGNIGVRVCGETVPDGMMLEQALRSIIDAMARLDIRRDPDEIMTLEVRLSSHRHGPVQFEQQRQRIFPSSHLRHEEPILPATMDQMFPQEQPVQPVQEASLQSIRHAYQANQAAGCVICGGRAEFLAELEPGSFTRLCSEHGNQFMTITVSGASAEEAIARMRAMPFRATRNLAEQVVRHFGERMLQDAVGAMVQEGMLRAGVPTGEVAGFDNMPPLLLQEEMNRGEAQQE